MCYCKFAWDAVMLRKKKGAAWSHKQSHKAKKYQLFQNTHTHKQDNRKVRLDFFVAPVVLSCVLFHA